MSYMDEYKFWLESDCFDEKTKEELRAIEGDDKEIQDRFYKNLKFGTGGMRGIMGAGTNRMNIYTVTKATQGLADYILEVGPEAAKRGVVIAHDCRNMSAEFICKLFRIKSPISRGLAIGTASHAVGTARAMELGEVEGAMSSLAIVVCGLCTVIGASIFSYLW